MTSVYLGLGSNISPRVEFLTLCLKALFLHYSNGFTYSSIYLTQPYQKLRQEDYYNCAVRFETSNACRDVLKITSGIETELGRKRTANRFEQRTIDIDILFFGNEIIDELDLIVPHYDVHQRDFFLIPVLELDNFKINPRSQKPLQQELADIPETKRTNPKKLFKPKL